MSASSVPQHRRAPRLRPRSAAAIGALAFAAAALAPLHASAQALDTLLLASGLNQPLFATSPLADGRLFVAQKGGTIASISAGVTRDFLSIPVSTSGERGLLGLAFDPGYGIAASAGYRRLFVDYIDRNTQQTVVASYRSSVDGSVADPASRVEILRVDQTGGFNNHKGGWLGFKPGDVNNLYIGTGDGGSANDPFNNAQNNGVLLGKLLRVDINRDDYAADPNRNYAIPLDNPLVGVAGARGEIYANGLRNPFRNSFDRLNGNLWIGDVGQGAREEIDIIRAASAGGQNFGWRIREGNIATPGVGDPPKSGLTDPLLSYDHSFGASVIGGYVVRQIGSPLFGKYVFGDFVSGRVWAIDADGSFRSLSEATELTAALNAGSAGPLGSIASFGEGANGELYIVDLGGRVIQVVPEPATLWLLLAGGLAVAWAARRREPESARAMMPAA